MTALRPLLRILVFGMSLTAAFLAGREWAGRQNHTAPAGDQEAHAPARPERALEHRPPESSGGLLQERALRQFEILNLGPEEIHARLAGLRHEPKTGANLELRDLLWTRLAEIDPADSAGRAHALPASGERAAALRQILAFWARQDAGSAWSWLQQAAVGPVERAELLPALLSQDFDDGEPGLAIARYRSMPDGPEKSRTLEALSRLFATFQPEGFLELLDATPEGGARQNMIDIFIAAWAAEDPASTAHWALAAEDPELQSTYLGALLAAWLPADPAHAVQWALSLPPGPNADQVKMLMIRNAQIPAEYAFALAGKISDPALQGQAFAVMIGRTAMMDGPNRARTYLERLPPGAPPAGAINNLVTAWQQRDSDAAENFTRTSPLIPEDQRRELLGRFQPAP